MKQILLMLNYARSGGTLLNKCLASLPDVVMLSEVNPMGGGSGADKSNPNSTIKDQARNWYGLEIKSDSFRGQVDEIYEYCVSNNKILIIRDWSYVNFSNFKKYNDNKPPRKFLILEELKGYDLKIFGFIRDAVDVWLSRGYYNPELFFDEYSCFVEEISKLSCPIFKYEDFVEHPKQEFNKICKELNIEFKDVFDSCLNYEKVNGDVQLKNKSRGIKQNEIKRIPRKKINSEKIAELNKCQKMKEINSKFNYSTSYYNSFFYDRLMVPVKNLYKKLFYGNS